MTTADFIDLLLGRQNPPPLFDAVSDPSSAALARLRARLVRFASGLSRVKDFEPAAWAGHAIGVEIGEMSDDALYALARVIVDLRTPVFVDSGAFGVFMRGLRGSSRIRPLDFHQVLARYDRLLALIATLNDASLRDGFECEATDDPSSSVAAWAQYEDDRMGRGAQEYLPAPMLVMPDVVGDQLASLALVRTHAEYIRHIVIGSGSARAIIPIQRGPLAFAEVYRQLVEIVGSDHFIVGVPSNAEAVTPREFTRFLAEARPRAVHILGAFAESRLGPRLSQIVASGHHEGISVSADANPLRSIIIQRGQTAAGRRDALVRRLGAPARIEELAAFIDAHGGPAGLQAHLAAADTDRRRRVVRFLAETSGVPAPLISEQLQRALPHARRLPLAA